jgi:hypothetical protein
MNVLNYGTSCTRVYRSAFESQSANRFPRLDFRHELRTRFNPLSASLPTGFLRIIFVPLVGVSEALFRTRRGGWRRHALSVSDFIYLTAAFCLALNTRAFKKTGFPDLWPPSLSRVQFLAPPRRSDRVRFTRILLEDARPVAYPASASRPRRKILRSLTINLEAA